MNQILQLSDIKHTNIGLVGGKAASLGELISAQIPVPPGFVITTDMFRAFIQESHISDDIQTAIKAVDHNVMHTIEKASETIQALINTHQLSSEQKIAITQAFQSLGAEFVAVRSSATAEDGANAAWAGQLDTFLNTTEQTLISHVKKCWASLYSPRAIFYRCEQGFQNTDVSVAVVVQAMIQSEKSGVAFSVHPVTQDDNQMIIEAGFGLGEAIVSGEVTPDSYVVIKQPKEIIDIYIATQTKALYKSENGGNTWQDLGQKGSEQLLSSEQIIELSDIIESIEQHYRFPCDIEWAFAYNQFFITQSRPITTLKKK